MPEKASLDPVRTRLRWARKYVDELKEASRRFMSTDPDPHTRSAIDYEQKPGHILVSVHLPDGFPEDFGRIMGGAFSELRALFDNLAYQLVLANGGQPTKQTAFPVLDAEPKFGWKRTTDALDGMSTTAIATIKGLQPFNERPKDPENSTLWLIDELNNINKHRLHHLAHLWIATCNGQLYMKGNVTAAEIHARFEHVAKRGIAEHGAPLLDVRWDAARARLASDEVMMEIDISADVALKNPERISFLDPDGVPTEALPIEHFLDSALEYCDARVLPRFAQEFE